MELLVTERFVNLFPCPTIAVVRGEIEDAYPNYGLQIEQLQETAMKPLKAQGLEPSTLSSHPHMSIWREAYQKFGTKAKNHKPTHEALARRLLKEEGWPKINPIVDIYLTNQASHLLPHGGYDVEALNGDLILDLSDGEEAFIPLGGGEEKTEAGEVIYRNNGQIVTRRWNYRDCEATKITDTTKSIVLVIESPSDAIPHTVVQAAADDLVDRYSQCFKGKFISTILNINRSALRFQI